MMAVRAAKYSDILQLCSLMEEMYEKSVYNGRGEVDYAIFKNICINSIREHGRKACLYVYEENGKVNGMIVGVLDRVYGVGKQFYATDLFFYVSEGASPFAAGKLLDKFLSWARSAPKVIEIFMGISGAIGDWKPKLKLYERRGLKMDGAMMVGEIVQ